MQAFVVALTFVLFGGVAAGQLPTTQTPRINPPSKFMRLVRDADSVSGSLELAIVRYGLPGQGHSGPTVDLISVAHIAESGFYQKINNMLPLYDIVLFEGVAPDSTESPSADTREYVGYMHQLYRLAGDLLDLRYQRDDIDYTLANMLHADLTLSELTLVLEREGDELPGSEEIQSLVSSLNHPAQTVDAYTQCKARRILASRLLHSNGESDFFPNVGLLPRNARVLQILGEQITAGKKKIAILYGAAHMPDFQEHLLSDFNMQPLKRRWLEAWDLCLYCHPSMESCR